MPDNFNELNKDNFELYAAKAYINYQCLDTDEFISDLNTIKRARKVLSTKNRNIRLLVNQFVLFFNVFSTEAAVKMMLYKTPPSQQAEVKTILYFLNYIDKKEIPPDTIDKELLKQLKEM